MKNSSMNFLNPLNKEISQTINFSNNNTENNKNYLNNIELQNNSNKTNGAIHNNIKIENQQMNDKSTHDYNEEYKRILNTKNNKKKYVKDRPGFDYKLEKQIIPREEHQIYLKRKTQKSNRSPKSNSINESSLKSLDFFEKSRYIGFKKLKNLTKNNLIKNDKMINELLDDNISEKGKNNDLNECMKTDLYNVKEIYNVEIMSDIKLYKNNFNFSTNKTLGSRTELLLKRNNFSGNSNNTSILNTSREIDEGNFYKDVYKYKSMRNLPSIISDVSRDNSNSKNINSLHFNDIIDNRDENNANEKENGAFNNNQISNSDKSNENIENLNPDSPTNFYKSCNLDRSKEKEKLKVKKINDNFTIMEEKLIDKQLNSKLSVLNYRTGTNRECNSPDFVKNNLFNMNEYSLLRNKLSDDFLINNSFTIKNINFQMENDNKYNNIFILNENHSNKNNFEKKNILDNFEETLHSKIEMGKDPLIESKVLSSKSLVKIEIENDLDKEENEILNKKLENLTHKMCSYSYKMEPIIGNFNKSLNYISKGEDMMIEISNNENGSSGNSKEDYIFNKIQDLYKKSKNEYSNMSFHSIKNEINSYDIIKCKDKALKNSAGLNVNGGDNEYYNTPLTFSNSSLIEKQKFTNKKIKNEKCEKNNKDKIFNNRNSNIDKISKKLDFDKFNHKINNIFIRVSKKENIDEHLQNFNSDKLSQIRNSIKDDKKLITSICDLSFSNFPLDNLTKNLNKNIYSSDISFPHSNLLDSEKNNKVINETDKKFFNCKRKIIFNREKISHYDENSPILMNELCQNNNEGLSNSSHTKCYPILVDEQMNLDLLKQNGRQIIIKPPKRDLDSYSRTEHKNYIPKKTPKHEDILNINNKSIDEKNIKRIISLSNNLRNDPSRNFGEKKKYTIWADQQTSNYATCPEVKIYDHKNRNRDTCNTKNENMNSLFFKNLDEINLSNEKQNMKKLQKRKDKKFKQIKQQMEHNKNIIFKEKKYKY